MSRLSLRRGRILPGPLAPLPLEARPPNGGLMIASFAATAIAVAGAALVLSRTPQAPAPMAMPVAASEPVAAAPASQAPSPLQVTGASAAPARVAAASPMPEVDGPTTAPAPTKPAVVKQAAAVPSADDSLYRVDLLPVLKAGNGAVGVDAAPNAGPAPAKHAKTASRKAANRTAGATSGPAQP